MYVCEELNNNHKVMEENLLGKGQLSVIYFIVFDVRFGCYFVM